MAKADLHVHSKYSEHPSEWFLQRLGAAESYTEPETAYRMAKERGMDFVTLTDHNRIEGVMLLQDRYPQDVITGVESTAYFPEDGCKIHVLIYGLTPSEFEDVQRLRTNIYDLRDYLKARNLAHAVAHATYFVNDRLRIEHLEKLMLLFDVFEGRNGGRNRINNESWTAAVERLTPERIEDLFRKYRIEPMSANPWVKGFTGGSDDHGALFIGTTYTTAEADGQAAFLEQIRAKAGRAAGRHNDYKSLAFTFYKVAYDFSKSKSSALSRSLFSQVTEMVFNKRSYGIRGWVRSRRIRVARVRSEDRIQSLFLELVEALNKDGEKPIEDKIALVYEKLSGISDTFFRILFESLERDIQNADVVRLIQSLSSSLPGIFLSVPFFSTLNHMNQGRQLVNELRARYGPTRPAEAKKVLWFTDTLTDLNGVSMTLREIARTGHAAGMDFKIVASLEDGRSKTTPPNVVDLPAIFEFRLPSYESYTLRVPALLRTLEIIQREEPEMVVISTPGPLGLLGLLIARVFNVRSIGVYHTDFALQARAIVKDDSVVGFLESYSRWFYMAMDEVRVPTREYVRILTDRGLNPAKMKVFSRGLDTALFAPRDEGWPELAGRWGLRDGINLLYVGRISEDKNLDFLLEAYKAAEKSIPELNLIIVGDGPYLDALRAKAVRLPRVVLTGRISYNDLPRVYSQADLFVFPSTTDTFGMAVLEAQACGLPALVSDAGGPQEIVQHGRTGWVVSTGRVMDWKDEIEQFVKLARTKQDRLTAIKKEARARAILNADWRSLLKEMFDEARFGTDVADAGRRPETPSADSEHAAANRSPAIPAPVILKGGTLDPALG